MAGCSEETTTPGTTDGTDIVEGEDTSQDGGDVIGTDGTPDTDEPDVQDQDDTTIEEDTFIDEDVVDTDTVETDTVETDTVETDTVETDTVETDTVETDTVETDIVETDIVDTDIVDTDVVDTDIVDTDIVETDIVDTDTVSTDTVDEDTFVPPTLCGEPDGDGTIGVKALLVGGGTTFLSPFDVALGPDGCQVYFTAIDKTTAQGAVFGVSGDGGDLTRLDTGGALVAPVGIAVSSDGDQLFVADLAHATPADAGAIVSLSSEGGAVTTVLSGYKPRSIAVIASEQAGDTVYFGGVGDDGQPGLFKLTGSTATAVPTGAVKLGDVAGITGEGNTLYVVSSTSADGHSAVYSVVNGVATKIGGPLKVGVAGGIAYSGDGSHLLVGTTNPKTGKAAFARININSGDTTFESPGNDALIEPSGLRRALNAEVYGYVDGLGTSGAGSLWILAK